MKRIFCSIGFVFLLCSALFTSCKKDETEDNQRKAIETYIESVIDKRRVEMGQDLVAEERGGVYLLLFAVDSSASERTLIRENDEVELKYLAWALNGAAFDTNDSVQAVQNNLVATKNESVRVGTLIAGLNTGLQRMALGDHGLILFPFTLGYGEGYVGQVRSQSALVFEVVITKVNGVEIQNW
jgi:FKBP-type peptidyl-prolyl cis-trans isomerase